MIQGQSWSWRYSSSRFAPDGLKERCALFFHCECFSAVHMPVAPLMCARSRALSVFCVAGSPTVNWRPPEPSNSGPGGRECLPRVWASKAPSKQVDGCCDHSTGTGSSNRASVTSGPCSVQDRLDDFGREQSQAQDAGHVGGRDPLALASSAMVVNSPDFSMRFQRKARASALTSALSFRRGCASPLASASPSVRRAS